MFGGNDVPSRRLQGSVAALIDDSLCLISFALGYFIYSIFTPETSSQHLLMLPKFGSQFSIALALYHIIYCRLPCFEAS